MLYPQQFMCNDVFGEMGDTFYGNDLFKNSALYREFLAEREEILKHKWLESEKAGYDIGFERALVDWVINHRAKWKQSRRTAGAVNLQK